MNSYSKNFSHQSQSYQDSSEEESEVKLTSKFHESTNNSSRSPYGKSKNREIGLIMENKENLKSNRSLMNHMIQIEEKYLDKITLLKERNEELESHILTLVEDKGRLEELFGELETEYNTVKAEKDMYKEKLEEYRSRNSEEMRALNFKYSEQLDSLNEKYSKSLEEISKTQNFNSKLKEERNFLMVESERFKTEVCSLREKLIESERSKSENKAGQALTLIRQELQTIKAEHEVAMTQKLKWESEAKKLKKKLEETRITYSALLDSHCKLIARDVKLKETQKLKGEKFSSIKILEIYKSEIEKMKQNTALILENYRSDMRRMGELLEFQKKKNLDLINDAKMGNKANSEQRHSRSFSNISCKTIVHHPEHQTLEPNNLCNMARKKRGHSSDFVNIGGKVIDRLSGKTRSVSRHKF